MTTAWFDVRPARPEAARALRERLALAGVTALPVDPDAADGPGLLFFDRVDPPLCEAVRRLSNRGLERLLAVALPGAGLEAPAAWALLEHGASDVFCWDHSPDPAGEVAARLARWRAVDEVVRSPLVRDNLVGSGPAWTNLLRQVVEVARFTDASLLIAGESGAGKELVARLIHTLDPRTPRRELVIVDCTTVVPELAGSEFFGHERGAFTNAHAPRDGAFALADGGTLFLDEVGELPPALQAELLRVVQEKTYKRVGSNAWQRAEFRLVCATNRDLVQEESQGRFRRDLYYRIAGCVLRLPALRDRPEDILPLARDFLRQLLPGPDPPELDPWVRDHLVRRPYPGNVRDLKQLMARIAARHVGPGPITAGDLPADERPASDSLPTAWCDAGFETAIRRALAWDIGLKEIGRAAEEAAVRIALAETQGNLPRAARRLGMSDRALQLRRAAERQRLVEPEVEAAAEPAAEAVEAALPAT